MKVGLDYHMSERSELRRMGAKAHKNSGRGQYQKADGNIDRFIVDVKEYVEFFGINLMLLYLSLAPAA